GECGQEKQAPAKAHNFRSIPNGTMAARRNGIPRQERKEKTGPEYFLRGGLPVLRKNENRPVSVPLHFPKSGYPVWHPSGFGRGFHFLLIHFLVLLHEIIGLFQQGGA